MPSIITDPAVWDSSLAERPGAWRISLDSSDPDTCLQDAFMDKLAGQIADKVLHGPGLAHVTGFALEQLGESAGERVFEGIGNRLGVLVIQNAAGDTVGRVEDKGANFDEPDVRGYTTSQELRPHSDGCDILALMCIRQAARGGDNFLVSSLALHNELARSRPDILEPLYRGFYNDLRSEKVGGDSGVSSSRWPVFVNHESTLSAGVNFKTIENAPRHTGVPLTREETDALAVLEGLANDDRFRIRLRLAPGDMLFINNLVLLHSRAAFEDDPSSRRLLLRLWINAFDARPLPPQVARIARAGMTAQPEPMV